MLGGLLPLLSQPRRSTSPLPLVGQATPKLLGTAPQTFRSSAPSPCACTPPAPLVYFYAPPTASAPGYPAQVAVVGDLVATLGNDTASSAGEEAVGDIVATMLGDSCVAAGARGARGAIAATLRADAMVAHGARGATGSINAQLGWDTAVGAGDEAVGHITVTLRSDSAAAVGARGARGSINTTLSGDTCVAAGNVTQVTRGPIIATMRNDGAAARAYVEPTVQLGAAVIGSTTLDLGPAVMPSTFSVDLGAAVVIDSSDLGTTVFA